mgnify:FL=1|jgi:hypothetical protein|tara:strand:- start:1531 stop:1902 length:372 start_codon:yes stop_codon:yes gene_type:complete
MAEPAGPRKSKNGKKVYSMTANAIRQRKLYGLGEFAPDAVAEVSQPIPIVDPPGPISSPEGFSNEPIGVVTTIEPIQELTPHLDDFTGEEPPNYFCLNCKQTVNLNDQQCPTCEESLNWDGLT